MTEAERAEISRMISEAMSTVANDIGLAVRIRPSPYFDLIVNGVGSFEVGKRGPEYIGLGVSPEDPE